MTRYYKDPDAVKDYVWDWSAWLSEGETIEDATVTVTPAAEDAPAAPTKDSEEFDDTTVTVWLSGGEVSMTAHRVTCHIVTNQGREEDKSLFFRIVEK